MSWDDQYKSKGERQIADFLAGAGIDFKYEYPLAVIDRGQVRIWYPDFRLPEYNTIVEYFGMNGSASYNQQAAHKMQVYQQAGINGIYMVESSFSDGWQERLLGRIEQSLEGNLRKIRGISREMYPMGTMVSDHA